MLAGRKTEYSNLGAAFAGWTESRTVFSVKTTAELPTLLQLIAPRPTPSL
jgi:hypothetical protein